jgi:Xaa-Pro aminopeptidase
MNTLPSTLGFSDFPLTPEALGIPDERTRYALRKQIVASKLNGTLLPAMRRHGIDMWLVLCREFHPDPFLEELGGGWPGVRNAYIFFDNGGDVPEKIFIGSHEQREDLFDDVYDVVTYYGYTKDGLAPFLQKAVAERDPKRIGINQSPTLPMADGLSVTLREYLEEAIGPEFSQRLVSAELVARDFRATRLPVEHGIYQRLCEWTVAWCSAAFTRHVIWPGVTTCADIHWWMRDQARRLGLGVEFLPGMRLIRQGENLPINSPKHPILHGDVITMDAGMAFDLYRSDYQRTAYVLRPGESSAPQGLVDAYRQAIEVRDQLTQRMIPGKIAHVVWDETMAWATAAGYEIMYPAAGGRKGTNQGARVGIYSHSIGNHTHDIGGRVAVDWPVAYGDRVRYPLNQDEWYAVELGMTIPIPEWEGRSVFIGIEEDAALTESGIVYFAPPQDELILIDP